MASTNLELQSNYIAGYLKLLDSVEIARVKFPEQYEALRFVAGQHREWVRRLAQIDDLPEVPKE